MEERLLLCRIAGEGGDVIRRDTKMAALIESNLADAALAFLDQASMATGITLQRACIEMFSQLGRAFDGHRIQHGGQWC